MPIRMFDLVTYPNTLLAFYNIDIAQNSVAPQVALSGVSKLYGYHVINKLYNIILHLSEASVTTSTIDELTCGSKFALEMII